MNRPIRVAHFGTYGVDTADGTEKTLAGLVAFMSEYGVTSEVWQREVGAATVRQRVVDGCQVWEVPAYPWPASFARGLLPAARQFVKSRQEHVDLVHFHSGFVPEAPAVAALLRIPYVCAPNGAYSQANLQASDAWFKQVLFRMRERRFVKRARFVHTVSAGEDEALHKLLPDVKTVLVPNAMDLRTVPEVAHRRPPLEAGAPLDLVFLGRLAVEQKGLDRLLDAYAAFLAITHDTRTRLRLVGPDYRKGRAMVEAMLSRLGLDERVQLQDSVFGAAKWSLLERAHALVYLSRWDGLPFSVLEALSVRLPVLITPATNLGPLVEQHQAGIVVSGDDILETARGIERLVNLPATQYASMGARARRLIEDHFAWPAVAGRMADAYREGALGMPDAVSARM
jgi:glycosyltransferase involved in cell wall biosynthesis